MEVVCGKAGVSLWLISCPQGQAALCVCWMHHQGVGCVCVLRVCVSLAVQGYTPAVLALAVCGGGEYSFLGATWALELCGGQLEAAAQHSTVHACTTHCSKGPGTTHWTCLQLGTGLGAVTLRP